MAGGSPAHSEIPSTLTFLILAHLRAKGSGCRTFGSGLRVKAADTRSYYYFIIILTLLWYAASLEYNNNDPQSLLNPTLVVEVLSPTTRDLDAADKKMSYKLIPSLQEIVLLIPQNHLSAASSAKGSYGSMHRRSIYLKKTIACKASGSISTGVRYRAMF
jgi:Uma2 family endonuclease